METSGWLGKALENRITVAGRPLQQP